MEEIACRLPSVPGRVYWNTKGWLCWFSFTCCWEPSPLPSLTSDLSSTFKSMYQAQGRKAAEYFGHRVFFVKSTTSFETEACLLETLFPFPFQTTFTFFLTFIIWPQLDLILTIKPTLIYLLSWLLFGKLFPSQAQFTILQQVWSFYPQHRKRVVKYPFCKAATQVRYHEQQKYLTFSYSPPSPKTPDAGG